MESNTDFRFHRQMFWRWTIHLNGYFSTICISTYSFGFMTKLETVLDFKRYLNMRNRDRSTINQNSQIEYIHIDSVVRSGTEFLWTLNYFWNEVGSYESSSPRIQSQKLFAISPSYTQFQLWYCWKAWAASTQFCHWRNYCHIPFDAIHVFSERLIN